jgi:hypothetical protein
VDVDQRATRPEQAVCLLQGRYHAVWLHTAKRPGKDRHIEGRPAGLRRELLKRRLAEHDPTLELPGQLLSPPRDRGRERLDRGHLFHPPRIAPRQATVAAADLEDAAPVEVDEVEQCANLVFLRINLDRHPLSSPSIGSHAIASSLLAAGSFSAKDRDLPRGATSCATRGVRPFSRAIRSIASPERKNARTGFLCKRCIRFMAMMMSLTTRVSRG